MALIKCKECNHEISTKAKSCPNCGAVQKEPLGSAGCTGLIFIIIFIVMVIVSFMDDGDKKSTSKKSPTASSTDKPKPKSKPKPKEKKVFKENETISVGYTSYGVWRSWWSRRLSNNEFANNKPNAMYLFIDLTVRNDDKKARMIPPFKLMDENGAEYEASSDGWTIDNFFGTLENLNPSVSKRGLIIFDVPKENKYNLVLSGGFWSVEDAFIQLDPKDHK